MKKMDRQFNDTVAPLFTERGLKKRESGIYTRDLGDGFLGWLGLPTTERDGTAAISPVVGIRHQTTHELISNILSDKPHKYLPPTASISIGFLLPTAKWQEWYFDETDKPDDYKSFVSMVETVSSSFWSEKRSLEALEEALMTFNYTRFKIEVYQRAPVLRYLSGDKKGAFSIWNEFSIEFNNINTARARYIIEKYDAFFASNS